MRVLPPLAWEGAGGTKGSTFSQNSSLTVQGLVRAYLLLAPSTFGGYYSCLYYRFLDKV